MNENEKEFLLFYMDQCWQEMRHLENLRERITLMLVTIAMATIGFAIQQKFAAETFPLPFLVIAIGFFGCLATLKLFQVHQMAQRRLDNWYKYLRDSCGEDAKILDLRDEADAKNREEFRVLGQIPHNYIWTAIHALLILSGVYLLTRYK